MMDVKQIGGAQEAGSQPLPGARQEEQVQAKARGSAWAHNLWMGFFYALAGYLLSGAELLFGAAPLGIALLAMADGRAVYVFLGLCVGTWGLADAPVRLCIYGAVLLIRLLAGFVWDRKKRKDDGGIMATLDHLFSEHISLRMATAAVGAFALGMWKLDLYGYLFYDLYGTVLATVAAPVAVLLGCGFFIRQSHTWQYRLGFLCVGAMLCFGAGDLKFYGISLSVFGAMMAALYVVRRAGMVSGMVTGTLFGLVISPALAPLFAFGAMTSGLLVPLVPAFGLMVGFGVSLAWGYYVEGLGILNGLLGALIGAYLLFGVWSKLFLSEEAEHPKVTAEAEAAASPSVSPVVMQAVHMAGEQERRRLQDTNARIRAVCQSFAELADVFDGLARRLQKPSEVDLQQICDRAFDVSCTGCPSKECCWGERYHTTCEEIGALCALLQREGRVRAEQVPADLSDRCERLPDLLEEINHNAAQHQEQLLLSDRTEIFALDYRVMSRLLASAMSEEDREYDADPLLSEKLAAEFAGDTDRQVSVSVIGQRRKQICLWSNDGAWLRRENQTIRSRAEAVCGFSLAEGRLHQTEAQKQEGAGTLYFIQGEKLSVRYSRRVIKADGEEQYCGDTADAFFGENGSFYAFISDGMGSGREAAMTSGIGGIFLRKLLRVGAGCEETLHLLNGFLRNRGGGSLHECSATVDLLRVDLMEKRAAFYKSGAAPTYVFRQGGLFKLRSRTVPIGIIQEPDIRKIDMEVGEGDLLIMVSDGVTRGKEECPWLFDLLRSHGDTRDTDRLADLIVKYAKDEGSTDDISALVIRIE